MRHFLLLITGMLLSISLYSYAHPAVNGVVIDKKSGEALIGALVLVEETRAYAITNDFGYFSLDNLRDTLLTINISYIGYQTLETTIRPEDKLQRFELESMFVDLPSVQIKPALSENTQLVSQVDIKNRPIRNAQEVLQLVPGLFIAQHAGGGKAEQIFLRGFDIDHGTDVALTVDGMPVNMVSHAHGQGYADLHFIIPELIENVDYQKGNYDAAVGNFATAGNVAFNTQNTLSESFIKLEAGQFNAFRAVTGLQLLGKEANAKQQAYVASSYEFMDGYFESSQNFYRFNALAKYQNQISDTELFRLTFSTFTSEWDASGQIPVRAVESGQIGRFGAIDDTEGGATSRTNVQLEHIKMIAPRTVLRSQAYYSSYNFELYSNFTFFDRDPVNGDQIRQKENRHILGSNIELTNDHNLLSIPAKLEAGLQVRFDAVNDNELSYSLNRVTTLEEVALGDVRELNAGIYLSEQLRITKRLQVNLGARFDAFRFQYEDETTAQYNPQSVTKNIVSPKLSMFYQLNPKIQLNAQSGIGFHSNDTRVVVAQDGREILPRAYGTEFNVITKPLPELLISTGFWRLDLDQEFVYVGDEGIVEPSGKSQRMGIDFSTRYQPFPWLTFDVDANYALPRSKEEAEGENYIPLAPLFTSTGGIQLLLPEGFGGSLRYRYLADRPANEDYSITADGYFLLDATINYRLRSFETGLVIQNILNQEWKEAQFATTSRLSDETTATEEIHFTPGSPFFARAYVTFFF